MKKPQECKTIETTLALLKTDYEKLWLGLIGSVGGLGTVLIKYPQKVWIVVASFLLTAGIVIAMGVIRFKILNLSRRLQNCEEEKNGNT